MRRRIALVVAWAAVTAVATAVAWQAVAVVGDNVSPRAAAPVALDELAGAGPGTTVGATEPAGGATSPAPPAGGTPASID
ncbi:MAG TPA: hypothetical protein VFO65_03680, partial [Acidimicrobiales bacterium]|nr:hypothetical protein [Acidimicrobiales bacterium]